jgi:hypothetical protein
MEQPTETNSLEVRWFGTGSPPQELVEWITDLGPVDTATRTDLYCSPVDPASNLKLRGGDGESVELKRRLGGPDRHEFGADVTGSVEQWYKWSFPLDHTPSLWTDDPTDLWLPVEKTRSLAVLDSTDHPSVDDGVSDYPVTTHVELTAVSALSETAWTCGLEAAGSPEHLEDAVSAVGPAVFGDAFPIGLSAKQSVGYAGWLRRLTADRGPAEAVVVPSKR